MANDCKIDQQMKIFINLIACFFLLGCNPFQHSKVYKNDTIVDAWYTDPGDWDDSRIPLIKPYELLKLKGQKDWEMALQSPMIGVAIHNVQEVNVLDSIIIVHSGETNLRGGLKVKEAWFVISAKKDPSEKGFAKKEDFEKELIDYHLKTAVFFEPDKVYSTFLKEKRINWKILPN